MYMYMYKQLRLHLYMSDRLARQLVNLHNQTDYHYRYCDCFANGEFCRDSCNCQNCKNSLQYEEERARAVKVSLQSTHAHTHTHRTSHGLIRKGCLKPKSMHGKCTYMYM